MLILFYAQEKKSYLGFIPTDQAQFVERIRQVIQQQKSEQQKGRQIQLQQQQQMQQQQIPGAAQSGNQFLSFLKSPVRWLLIFLNAFLKMSKYIDNCDATSIFGLLSQTKLDKALLKAIIRLVGT